MFSVSPGEAGSFQERYQRLLEEWIREFVHPNPKDKSQIDKSEVRITETTPEGEKLLYGKVSSGKLINNLTPEKIAHLEDLRNTPVGAVAQEAGAITVTVEGKVVLQSDASGKVLVNLLYTEQQLQVSSPTPVEVPAISLAPTQVEVTPEVSVVNSSDFFEDYFLQDYPPQSPPMSTTAPTVVPMPESPPVSAVRELPTQASENSKSGLATLQQSIESLQDGPLKQVLQGVVAEMQVSRTQQQPPDVLLEELLTRRMASPKKINWWEQVGNQLEVTFSSISSKFEQYRSASALKTLFARSAIQDGQAYQAAAYTLTCRNREYTLSDTSGKPLMRFRSTPLGVRVDRSLPPLASEHYLQLQHLRSDLVAGRNPRGAFAPVGEQESQYLKRVNIITQALTQYATNQKTSVQVDGKFSYKWRSTPDGKVRIDAKDGRGPLLVSAGGQLRCRMEERDLVHFEQMLPVLQAGSRTQSMSASRNKSELSLN